MKIKDRYEVYQSMNLTPYEVRLLDLCIEGDWTEFLVCLDKYLAYRKEFASRIPKRSQPTGGNYLHWNSQLSADQFSVIKKVFTYMNLVPRSLEARQSPIINQIKEQVAILCKN